MKHKIGMEMTTLQGNKFLDVGQQEDDASNFGGRGSNEHQGVIKIFYRWNCDTAGDTAITTNQNRIMIAVVTNCNKAWSRVCVSE